MKTVIDGNVYDLVMDDGNEYVAHFLDGQTLAWAGRGEPFVSITYRCEQINPQTAMVGFFITEGSLQTCITLVLDLDNHLVTMIKANVGLNPARSRLTTHRIVFGAIQQPGIPLPVKRHSYTGDLVGKKIAWQYSPYVKLTHIYLSERYLRGSLKNMPPIDEHTPDSVKADIEDRAKRWGSLFFEEPCSMIKIHQNLYLVGMIEDFRNRVDPRTGGGDMVFVIDMVQMCDYIRFIRWGNGQAPEVRFHCASGEVISENDEMELLPSPYRVE